MQMTNAMEKVYTGTAEQLANDDALMAELQRLDRLRTDLEEYSHQELIEYISSQNTLACIATQNAGAATSELMKRLTPAGG
jgi:hypothetical protein